MKYKHLKVDMDYSADPIWGSVAEETTQFANCSLSEFEGILSKELLHGLEVYRSMWEKAHWSEFMQLSVFFEWPGEDLVHECLQELEVELAAQLKKELPDVRVYYSQRLNNKWGLVEINSEPHAGIWNTSVG